jgi:hypothetical protein
MQTLRGPKCSHQMLHARGSSTARQITSSELSKYVCHERLTSYMLRIMLASGEQQYGAKCLDATLEQRHGGVPQRPVCRRSGAGSEVQSPDAR